MELGLFTRSRRSGNGFDRRPVFSIPFPFEGQANGYNSHGNANEKLVLSCHGGWRACRASCIYCVGNFRCISHARAALVGVGACDNDCLRNCRGDDTVGVSFNAGGKLVRGARGCLALSRAFPAALPRHNRLSSRSVGAACCSRGRCVRAQLGNIRPSISQTRLARLNWRESQIGRRRWRRTESKSSKNFVPK